jgi:hypothetical protein
MTQRKIKHTTISKEELMGASSGPQPLDLPPADPVGWQLQHQSG